MFFQRKGFLLVFACFVAVSNQFCKPLSEKDGFLAIHCLARHVRLLELLEYYTKAPRSDIIRMLAYEGIPFEHPLISWGAQMVQTKKTLMPFVSIWKLFKNCKAGDHNCDKEFLLECGRFICITYQQIIAYKNPDNKVTLTDVITLYSRIALLPLPELLTVLDELYEHIKIITDEYKTEEPFSAITWIQNYWWVPPVAAMSLIISYLKWIGGR